MKLRFSTGMSHAVVAALTAVAAAVLFPSGALAADAAPAPAAGAKRPKVCLVLSGGGARGAAHVGVIRVLEEMRIPIDCIAGTSMGALVGAAYASGMTLPEMDQFIAGMSVEKLFKEKPPRDELATRRKLDDFRNYFGPELGIGNDRAMVAKGVISGVQLETLLRQLSKVKGYRKFDTLPIPFRAVATDLVTGQAVIFSEGDLPNVMRASMSVPGAVAPAEFGGMILVDGMLTSNLPVQTARAMGAEVIIAVNVGTPLLKREQLTGILGVAGQMLSILTEQNVQASIASLKTTDILISPELGNYTTGDFDVLPKIAPLGEAATRKAAELLSHLALPVAEYAALRKRQQGVVEPDMRAIDEIRFDNLKRVNPESVQAVMSTEVNRPVEQEVLDGDMRRIYGTGDFEHVNYRIVDESGRRVLAVDAVEKSWGPDYARVGVGLSSDFSGMTAFALQLSYRKTWLNRLGAEWRTDAQLGNNNSVRSEFYQPLQSSRRPWYVAPNLVLEQHRVNLYQGEDRVASYAVSSGLAGVDLGLQLEPYGTLRMGIEGGQVRQEFIVGPESLRPSVSNLKHDGFSAGAFFDQLDNVVVPRRGWTAQAQVFSSSPSLGADHAYTKWSASAMGAYSFGENTLNLAVKGAGRIGNNPLPAYEQFQWGGFLRQSGYSTGQFTGQSLQYARAMYMRRIFKGELFEGAYGGAAFEWSKVGQPLLPGNPDGLLKSMTLFVALDTLVGPLYLAYGHAATGASSLYFYLGRPF